MYITISVFVSSYTVSVCVCVCIFVLVCVCSYVGCVGIYGQEQKKTTRIKQRLESNGCVGGRRNAKRKEAVTVGNKSG